MEIINAIWFHPMGGPTIGIIIGKDENTDEYKSYIGTVPGYNQMTDIHIVSKTGGKFPVEVAKVLFGIKE